MKKKLNPVAYHLPNTQLWVLVDETTARLFCTNALDEWKRLNPDPYFQIPQAWDSQCKKCGVLAFSTQEEWLLEARNHEKMGWGSLELTKQIARIKKMKRIWEVMKE
jgi:hypothetical protein